MPVYLLSLSSESLGATILGENWADCIPHHVSVIKLPTTYWWHNFYKWFCCWKEVTWKSNSLSHEVCMRTVWKITSWLINGTNSVQPFRRKIKEITMQSHTLLEFIHTVSLKWGRDPLTTLCILWNTGSQSPASLLHPDSQHLCNLLPPVDQNKLWTWFLAWFPQETKLAQSQFEDGHVPERSRLTRQQRLCNNEICEACSNCTELRARPRPTKQGRTWSINTYRVTTFAAYRAM